MKNPFVGIVAATLAGLLSWALIEFADVSNRFLVGGFLAVWIGLIIELIWLLFDERREVGHKLATIESLQREAAPKYDEAKAEAKGIQRYVSSLEQSIKQGLLRSPIRISPHQENGMNDYRITLRRTKIKHTTKYPTA